MKKLLILAVVGLSTAPLAANAALLHHYNLTDGTDSVGTANGTLSGNATFTNGMLVTPGTDATSYLSLPATVGTGITGDFSIQVYTSTTNAGTSYSTLFSFATQQSDNNFLLFNANRPGLNASSFNFRQSPSNAGEQNVSGGSALLANGTVHDLLLTYAAGTGAVAIYNNGALAATATIGAGFNFSLATGSNLAAGTATFNGINGHAPFTGDNTYAGSTDDFRIYNQVVTATQAARLDTAGVNATNAAIAAIVPEPSTWAFLFGGAGLLGLSLHRRSTRRA